MSKSNTKSKTAYEEKTGLFVCAYSCVQNQLDTADFLIDGLTSRRASGAERCGTLITLTLSKGSTAGLHLLRADVPAKAQDTKLFTSQREMNRRRLFDLLNLRVPCGLRAL
jgi:hypothetical protein